jgi:two-component sensor histidine kinase
LFNCFAFSQEINKHFIDSLVSNHQPNTNDEFEKEFLNLGDKIGRQDNALHLYQYLDSISNGQPKITLSFYNKYVSYLYRTSKFKEGLEINSKGLKLAKKHNYSRITFEYLQIKSYGFSSNQSVDSALFYANEAEKIVLKNKDLLGHKLHTVYLRKAEVETLLGNAEQRDFFFEKAVESLESYPDDRKNGFVLAYVTNHFKHLKNYAKHAYYAQKLKAYYLRRDGFSNPQKHISISSFLNFENTEEQVHELKKIVNLSPQDSVISIDQRYLINTLADGLIKIEEYDQAIFYLEKLLKSDKQLPSIGNLLNYSLLKQAYYLKGDYKNALAVFETQKIIIDSIRTELAYSKIADVEIKYETEKKTEKIEFLQAQNKSKEKQKFLYQMLALSGLIIASLLGYFGYKNRKQKRVLAKQKNELEITVEEKNVLFKEIHHRVKNNLQMVSSLLFLQGQNIEDTKAKSAIKDAQNRVRSLSLIHQKLYSRKHITGVETEGYFTDLITDIFNSHKLESQNINYNLDIESHVLNVDTLTPIGLILNELIVNVLKHAFKQNHSENKLYINFYKKENTLILKVTDNGIGYKDTVKKKSFGLKLINSLAKKLDAVFTIKATLPKGTEAILIINDFEIIDTK